MKLFYLFLFSILFAASANNAVAQVDCSISAGNDIKVCKSSVVSLLVTGNTENIQWTDTSGQILSTSTTTNQEITESKTFYVINKIPFGNELIVNGDFENGAQNFTSSYKESCVEGTMPQGAYCITENSGKFHRGWSDCQSVSKGSKMLISDGAVKANENIWCQTVNVEQNKDYAFSAWITSVFKESPPVMQFSINNNLLGQPFQGKETPCEWQEFFQIWNSGTSTTAEICILNQNTVSQGNDFAIDNISLRETCYHKDSVKVHIIDSIKVDLGSDDSFCAGDDHVIKNTSINEHHDLQYNWSTGETSKTITVTTPTSYSLEISTLEGCTGNDTVVFSDTGIPNQTLPEDTNICFTAHPVVHFKSGTAQTTEWSHNEIIDTATNYALTEPGLYDLILSNGKHCTVRHSILVEDKCSKNLFIPTAFTPNGDGMNDSFGPESVETYTYEFVILNKWGNVLFEGENVQDKWDGTFQSKKCPVGVYVYKLSYSVVNFYTNRVEKITKAGHFSLLR